MPVVAGTMSDSGSLREVIACSKLSDNGDERKSANEGKTFVLFRSSTLSESLEQARAVVSQTAVVDTSDT